MFRKVTLARHDLRLRLLVLLGGALLLCIAIFIVIAYLGLKSNLNHDLASKVRHAQHLYGVLVEQRKEVLLANLEPLLDNPQLKQAFLRQDREYLQTLSLPLFSHLREVHDISHFYYHTPEGYNFLRVHQPERYGDRIDRHTMREASASMLQSSGLELGPLGTFTLRLVMPWYEQGRLIGFIELGEEFQPIISEAAASSGVDMLVMIDKRFLDRESWQAGMQMLSRASQWDQFSNMVVVDETRIGLSRMLKGLAADSPLGLQQQISLSVGDEEYVGRALPLKDADAKVVGRWYVLHNATASMSDFRQSLSVILLLCLSVGFVLLAIFNRTLRRIEYQLRGAHEGLEQLVGERTRELQRALNEVEVNREQVRVVLKSIHDPILVVDDDSRVWLANRSARELFHLGDEDLSGRRLSDLLDAQLCRQLATMQPAGNPMLDVDIERMQAGKVELCTYAVQTTSVALGDESQAFIFMFHDVTRARQLERLKSEFISNTAHELNTPLATIVGYSELLLDPEQDFTAETREEFLHTIYQKANHLNHLLAQILDISRLEAGRPIPLAIEEFSLQEVLARLLEHLPIIHPRHRFRLQQSEAAVISADPGHFHQIMENLLSNAVKYSPEGGEVTVEVGSEDDAFLHIVVKDQGVGMTREEASQAFERFYRVDASDSATRGVGLGLTITRQLVESHGGKIWLSSSPGEGTEVHFTMPGHFAHATRRRI